MREFRYRIKMLLPEMNDYFITDPLHDPIPDTSMSILDMPVVYEPYVLEEGHDTSLVESPDVLLYYDGTPIAMVNLHHLLTALRRSYNESTVESLTERNPSMSLRELLERLDGSDVNINVLITTLIRIYGHDSTTALMEENPEFSLSGLTTALYRYGAR